MYGYIYKTVNLVNGKFYIGKHKYHKPQIDPSYLGSGIKLKSAIQKYGIQHFQTELLEVCNTAEEMNQREIWWIQQTDACNPDIGYNMSQGGDGNVPYERLVAGAKKRIGMRHSPESNAKISKALKNKPKSTLHKAHLSKNHHAKTRHIKLFKDGSYEVTKQSVAKLAESLSVTTIQLRRASEMGDFRCGDFFLLDLMKPAAAFNHQYRYSREKCIFDPIRGDVVSHNTIRLRNQHNIKQYKGVDLYNFTPEKQKEKDSFVLYYTNLQSTIFKETENMKFDPIVISLLDCDMYKLTMLGVMSSKHMDLCGQYHFKCRNAGVKFTPEMLEEINAQIDHLCTLRFTQDELNYLSKIRFMKRGFINFLRFWQPMRDYVTTSLSEAGELSIIVDGPIFAIMMFEIYLLEIVNEVYFRMQYDYDVLVASAREKLDAKIAKFKDGTYTFKFAEFGCRRRLSREWEDEVVRRLAAEVPNMVGTSNVYLAKKYGLTPIGTYAHEYVQMFQGIDSIPLAYTNHYALQEWYDYYKGDNGTALTDTLGTDLFLLDFDRSMSNNFTGVRHDSGDPYEWGEKMIAHYESYGIDPKTKTLLFSDSLNFDKAQALHDYFKDRTKVSFGIGTFVSNDTCEKALNIVIKLQYVNGRPVAKISDNPGKAMCQDGDYLQYLKNAVAFRLNREKQ